MATGLSITLVKVNGFAQYTCVNCGVASEGSHVSLELDALSNDALEIAVRNMSNSNMPVGWASYAHNAFKCPNCKT